MEYAKSNNLKCLGTRTSVDNGDIIMGFRGNSSLAKSVHTNIKVWQSLAKAGQMSVTVQCLKDPMDVKQVYICSSENVHVFLWVCYNDALIY